MSYLVHLQSNLVISWTRGTKKNRRDIHNVDFTYLPVYMNYFFSKTRPLKVHGNQDIYFQDIKKDLSLFERDCHICWVFFVCAGTCITCIFTKDFPEMC